MFYPEMFEHAFYKRAIANWHAPKSSLDVERCKRMKWIKEVLNDDGIVPRKGYDKARNRYDNSSRVAFLAPNDYIVVIRKAGATWRFVTAYLVDNEWAKNKILSSPIWNP